MRRQSQASLTDLTKGMLTKLEGVTRAAMAETADAAASGLERMNQAHQRELKAAKGLPGHDVIQSVAMLINALGNIHSGVRQRDIPTLETVGGKGSKLAFEGALEKAQKGVALGARFGLRAEVFDTPLSRGLGQGTVELFVGSQGLMSLYHTFTPTSKMSGIDYWAVFPGFGPAKDQVIDALVAQPGKSVDIVQILRINVLDPAIAKLKNRTAE